MLKKYFLHFFLFEKFFDINQFYDSELFRFDYNGEGKWPQFLQSAKTSISK